MLPVFKKRTEGCRFRAACDGVGVTAAPIWNSACDRKFGANRLRAPPQTPTRCAGPDERPAPDPAPNRGRTARVHGRGLAPGRGGRAAPGPRRTRSGHRPRCFVGDATLPFSRNQHWQMARAAPHKPGRDPRVEGYDPGGTALITSNRFEGLPEWMGTLPPLRTDPLARQRLGELQHRTEERDAVVAVVR